MINFAHRGASAYYPENTILAFKKAIEFGATGIEFDVHKSKDGELVVIHDENIERTFLGNAYVKDSTLKELKKFKCRNNVFRDNEDCKIPTLREVLELVKNTNIYLNIEIKTDEILYEGIEEDIIDIIYEFNIKDRVILSSFNHESIRKVKAIDHSIKCGILYFIKINDVINYAKSLGVEALHPDKMFLKDDFIEEAHKAGLEVNTYTVNSPIKMRKFISENIDGIFTDYTDILDQILKDDKK